MSGDLLKTILVYATIPVYVAGLLVLVAFIARYQLQLSLSQAVKRVLKPSSQKKGGAKQDAYPPIAYALVLLLSAFLVVIAFFLAAKSKRP